MEVPFPAKSHPLPSLMITNWLSQSFTSLPPTPKQVEEGKRHIPESRLVLFSLLAEYTFDSRFLSNTGFRCLQTDCLDRRVI